MKQDIICPGVPDAEMLGAAVGEFLRTVRPDRQRLYDYYRGEQPVNKGEAVRAVPIICCARRSHATSRRYTRDTFSASPLPSPTARLRRASDTRR